MLMYRIEVIDIATDLFNQHALHIIEFPVIKETKCGVWIRIDYLRKKFVNTNAKKQFAHKSIEDAKEAFVARKKRHIEILKYQLDKAEAGLRLCSNI